MNNSGSNNNNNNNQQKQQPPLDWDTDAAAAYYAYATTRSQQQAGAPMNPELFAHYTSYGHTLWAALDQEQQAYYLSFAQQAMPVNSQPDQLFYAQHLAISAIYPHFHQYFNTSSPLSSIRPPPNFTSTPTPTPSSSTSRPSSSSLPWRYKKTSGGPMNGEIYDPERRKSVVGAFSKATLALLKDVPQETRDWIKRERLTPIAKAFIDGVSLSPLPDPVTFVTSSISEYKTVGPGSKRQTERPVTSPHLAAAPHAPSATPEPRPTSSSGYVNSNDLHKMSISPDVKKKWNGPRPSPSKKTSTESPAARPTLSPSKKPSPPAAAKPSWTTYAKPGWSNKNPADEKPLWSAKWSPSKKKIAVDDDPELASKKNEREQRFKQHAQRLAAERAASAAMARVNLAHYTEVHRAARTAAGELDDGEAGGDLDDVVVGTSQVLEREFLRLTSAPNPALVRPLPILQKSILLLMTKWNAQKDYRYICDQLKSVRQDLLVQRIQNAFTVSVYEMHARIALEMQDFSEFNQCQTQLKILYDRGVSGCHSEFLAYRILYFIYTKSRRDMKMLLSSLTPGDRSNPYVERALSVRTAIQRGDFVTFFRIYQSGDLLMGKYIMDPMVDRERVKGLWILTKSHTSIPLATVVESLAWDSAPDARSLINSIVDKVCDGNLVQPVPHDRAEIYVGQNDTAINGRKLRAIAEAWLISFTHVDIKGQLD